MCEASSCIPLHLFFMFKSSLLCYLILETAMYYHVILMHCKNHKHCFVAQIASQFTIRSLAHSQKCCHCWNFSKTYLTNYCTLKKIKFLEQLKSGESDFLACIALVCRMRVIWSGGGRWRRCACMAAHLFCNVAVLYLIYLLTQNVFYIYLL